MYYLADFSLLRDLAKQAVKQRQIPPVSQIRKGIGQSFKDVIKDPRKIGQTVDDGLYADWVANNIAQGLGKTRAGLTAQGVGKVITSNPVKNLAVNTGGFLASTTPLGLAGDLVGAYGVRKTLEDGYSTQRAIRKSVKKFPHLNPQQRTKDVLERSKKTVRALHRKNQNAYVGDTVGWGIGNSAAASIPLPVPLRGAAVAMSTGDIVEKGLRNGVKGKPFKQNLQEMGQSFKNRFNIKKQIADGFEREEKMRQRLNRKLGASLVQTPSSFSRKIITSNLQAPPLYLSDF